MRDIGLISGRRAVAVGVLGLVVAAMAAGGTTDAAMAEAAKAIETGPSSLPSGAALTLPLWPAGAPGSEAKKGLPEVAVFGGASGAGTGAGGAGGAAAGSRLSAGAPTGSPNLASIHNPSLVAFLPEKGRGTGDAVVVLPGGGHRLLVIEKEGFTIARWLVGHGIAAFVVKYRLAREAGSSYRVDVEALADVQRALRLVKSRAAGWGIDPARVGVMGFSAGGELAALAAMRADAARANPAAADAVDRADGRPAFQALVYPGASQNIVPAKDAPPAFIVAGFDDRPDISEGVARVYLAFKQAGIPAELHVYAGAGHGFALRPGPASGWIDRFAAWLHERAVSPRPAPASASPR